MGATLFRPGQLRSYLSLEEYERDEIAERIVDEFSKLSHEARENLINRLKLKVELETFESKINCKCFYARIDDFEDLILMTCGLDELIKIHTTILIEETLCGDI
jgi:hypothetical protein